MQDLRIDIQKNLLTSNENSYNLRNHSAFYVSKVDLSQRIVGREVTSNLLQFGAGLLHHRDSDNDIDNNGYPDVVVAATKSDDVIVLFSKPVIFATASINMSSSTVNVIECLRNSNQACVTMEFEISARKASVSDKKRNEFGG